MTSSPGPALGGVVAEALGLRWQVHADPYGLGLDALAGLAVRRNPKRAQLIVSTVLAKHVPVRPSAVRAAGLLLAALLHQRMGGQSPVLTGDLLTDPARAADVARLAIGQLPGAPAVIGFCETATGLGHTVADAFSGAVYVHTTRRPDASVPTLLGFDEEHSHAVAHHLQAPPGFLDHDRPVVLVDDELSTGTTALNTIAELQALRPRGLYVVATLLDLRDDEARCAFAARADELGVRVEVVALIDGALVLPGDLLQRASLLQAEAEAASPDRSGWSAAVPELRRDWPLAVATGGRHGFSADDRAPFTEAISALAAGLSLGSGRVLVVGTEELMYAPVRLAHALELAGHDVLVQSTTRSPVLALDREGYAIRRQLTFPAPDDAQRASHLYNVVPPTCPAEARYGDIVVVAEDVSVSTGALMSALRPWATDAIHLVVLPA